MDTDLQVLHERVSRLETILGPLPVSKCIHSSIAPMRDRLREIVSDEVVAAASAVRMLSHTTPNLRGLSQVRRARVTHAQNVVDRAVLMLQKLEDLVQGTRSGEFCITVQDGAKLHEINRRVQMLEKQVGEEEQKVDALLAEFESVTTRFNKCIVNLAELARSERVRENV